MEIVTITTVNVQDVSYGAYFTNFHGGLRMSSTYKRCSVRLCFHVFVGGRMSYLPYLCLCVNSGVQRIMCYVFVLFFFILLSVSLDDPFSIILCLFLVYSKNFNRKFCMSLLFILQAGCL